MKTFKYFAITFIALTFLFACEPEDEIIPDIKVNEDKAPINLKAKTIELDNQLSIELNWEGNLQNQASYVLERSANDSTHWTEIARLDKGVTSFIDAELSQDSSFYYRIKTISIRKQPKYSSLAFFYFGTRAPNAPTNLRAKPLSTPRMNLSWQDDSNNELGFIIQRSLNGRNWIEVAKVKANTTSYQDRGLQEATAYYYRVMAYNFDYRTFKQVNSKSSNIAINVTLKFIDAPSDLKANALAGTPFIKLEWKDNSDDEKNFIIERRRNEEATWYEIGRVDNNKTTYRDEDTDIYTNYSYRVYALSGNIKSASTEAVLVTSEDFPLLERYVSFNPNNLELEESTITGWHVKSDETYLNTLPEFSQALNFLNVLSHYKMNRLYEVPGLRYLIVNNESPSGAMDGEDCIPFDSDNLEVKMVDGTWKIVDGGLYILSYPANEKGKADMAYRVIKKYGFTYICYLGRPNAYFSYFKK